LVTPREDLKFFPGTQPTGQPERNQLRLFLTSDLLFDTDHFAATVDQLLQLLRKTLHSSTRNTLAAGVSA
jgi:hypothetical protein